MSDLADATLFEAIIVPHRSLSRRGLRILVGTLCLICGINAAVFISLGAWPVGGFTGIELLLAAFLLQLNVRSGRAREVLLLSRSRLRIQRTDPNGRRSERELASGWLQMALEEVPGRVPRLVLLARDVREEVATVLGEVEKRDLAVALSEALDRMRHPVFDNPQLRDGATGSRRHGYGDSGASDLIRS